MVPATGFLDDRFMSEGTGWGATDTFLGDAAFFALAPLGPTESRNDSAAAALIDCGEPATDAK